MLAIRHRQERDHVTARHWLLLALLLPLVACGSAPSPLIRTAPTATASSAPPMPMLAPSASPTSISFSGHGSLTRPLTLTAGMWRVDWLASGREQFTVVLMSERTLTLVEAASPDSGHTEFQVAGGAYQLTISAKQLDWSLTFSQGA